MTDQSPDDHEALEGPGTEEGVIGSLDVQRLEHFADEIRQIGHSAHNNFGERIRSLGDYVGQWAREARRRLAEDRLPDDAGTPTQQQHRHDTPPS